MKIRTVKKVLKAMTEERKTPLSRKVTFDHIQYFANNTDHQKPKRRETK